MLVNTLAPVMLVIVIFIIGCYPTLLLSLPCRFACMVCKHCPVFDTVAVLSIHRQGKKHLASKFLLSPPCKHLFRLSEQRKAEELYFFIFQFHEKWSEDEERKFKTMKLNLISYSNPVFLYSEIPREDLLRGSLFVSRHCKSSG